MLSTLSDSEVKDWKEMLEDLLFSKNSNSASYIIFIGMHWDENLCEKILEFATFLSL